MLHQFKKYSIYLAPLILLLGVLLRINVYAQNRSLIIDEANLARNIVEKNLGAFFQSLDYQQYCPPIFLILSKYNIWLFGTNEFALKLLPLASGMVTLWLFWLLVKKYIDNQVVKCYLLLVSCFSVLMIRYATELKQYSTDGAITLGLIYAAIHFKNISWTIKQSLAWAIVGSLCIWTSMSSIFVLAAVGFGFLYQSLVHQKGMTLGLIGVAVFWLLNFAVYFLSILHQDSTSESLQTYHNNFFFNFFPTSIADLSLDYNLYLGLMTSVTDQTAISLIAGTLFLLIGISTILKKDKFAAFLFLLPILFSLIASNLKLYSLIPRLSLFIIPLILLLLGIGLAAIWQKSNNILKAGLIVVLLIGIINKEGYCYFWTKMEFEDSKSALAYLKQNHQPQQLIFVQHDAVPAFVFYNNLHDHATALKPVYLANWDDKPATKIPNLTINDTSFWLFFAHTFPQDQEAYLQSAKQISNEIKSYQGTFAAAYLFQLK